MAVSARTANKVTGPVSTFHDMRMGSSVRAGTFPFEIGDERVTGWHAHDLHQLEYAFEGTAQVETETAQYLLPPQQAIWIPAGTRHCTTLTRVRTVSVFFDPLLGLEAGERVRILAVAPVMREMVLYARRWPITRVEADPTSDGFFATLGQMLVDSLDEELPLSLPASTDPLVAAVMAYTSDNQSRSLELGEVCAAVGVSERSLRRAFAAETGMGWSRYLLTSRLMKAMALLAQPQPNVLGVAMAVGFESVSGFTRAFRRYTGETPLVYRSRVAPVRVRGGPWPPGTSALR